MSPDEVKRLGVGEMVLVEKNPHRVELVSVAQATHSPPAPLAEAA